MDKKLSLSIIFLVVALFGCANNKAKTQMMDTLYSERNELIVLDNNYSKFKEAAKYFTDVYYSDYSAAYNTEDCFTYFGIAKSNFSNLSDNMDTSKYATLIDLKDSCNYMVSFIEIYMLKCEGKINQDNIDSAEASLADLINKALASEKKFLDNAGQLLSKYKYDLEVYSTYTAQEAQKKSQFWSQFFGVLAGTLASSLADQDSSQPSTFTITDTQTGQIKHCNTIAGFLNCY